jgi:hypothetical protein
MSPFDESRFSIFDRVKAFTAEGLANADVSAASAASARNENQLIPWEPGPEGVFGSDALEELLAKYKLPNEGDEISPDSGLRLLAPVGWKGKGIIDGIVGLPGYQAGAEIGADAAFKSFSIDPSWPVGWPGRVAPAFPWPIPINAPDELAHALEQSRAQMRGFVTPAVDRKSPSMSVDIVDLSTDGLKGPFLAIRFLRAGTKPSRLAPELSLARVNRSEPLVLLPLQGRSPQSVLTDFLYQLAHNLPVDEAAWKTVRQHNYGQPPVVLASRDFLGQAQLSDNIPGLQARLERLPPDSTLEITGYDLSKFNWHVFQDSSPSQSTVGRVLEILSQTNDFDWSHESDSAEGLLAVTRAIAAREQAMSSPSRRLSPLARIDWDKVVDKLPSVHIPGGFLGGNIAAGSGLDLKGILKNVVGAATSRADAPAAAQRGETVQTTAAEPPPDRYTNVKVFDGSREILKNVEPLVVARTYFFDVSIGTRREGVTAVDKDQPVIRPFGQVDSVSIWVVITDETVAAGGTPLAAFTFDKRFESLTLPLEGGSLGDARFEVTPNPDAFASGGRGTIGVRLYHKLNLIDHIELSIYVAATAEARPTDGRPAFVPTFDGGIVPPDATSVSRALTISIGRTAGTDLYRFSFEATKEPSGKPSLVADKVLPETTLNDYVARFRGILLKTVFNAGLKEVAVDEGQRDKLIGDLSELGARIILNLFDYQSSRGDLFALGQMVKEALPDIALIQVTLLKNAENFIFPWQILTLDPTAAAGHENLWGYRFVIEVKRFVDRTRAAEPRAPRDVRLRYARFNFTNEPSHYTLLQQALGKARNKVILDQPVIENQAAFIAALVSGAMDFLYVYAHGHASAPATPAGLAYNNGVRLQIAAIAQQLKQNPLASAEQSAAWTDTYNLLLKAASDTGVSALALKNYAEIPLAEILKHQFRLQDAPIVFLNTCDSAQIWNAVDDSFVGLFLGRGARAVLGTETTIPIVFADVFGLAVLTELFAGRTLGDAVMTARKAMFEEKNNPLGLCYSVYGDANASLFPPSVASNQGVVS